MRNRILRGVARIACRKYRLVLRLALVLTVISWLPPIISHFRGGLHAPFDIATMLPQDVRASRDFTRAVTDFDSVDEAVVVFHLGSEKEREPTAKELKANPELGSDAAKAARRRAREQYVEVAGLAADKLVEELQKDERIQSAFCRMFRPEDRDYLLYEALPSFGLLLLDESELPRVKELLQPENIRRSVAALKTRSSSSMSAAMDLDEFIVLDAIGLGSVFQRSLNRYGLQGGLAEGVKGGYFIDKERTMLLVVIQPDRPAQSIDFSESISELIHETADRIYEETIPEASRQSIRIEFGGGYEAAVRYTSHVSSNLFSTLLTSLIGVLAIFGLIFRRFGVLMYIGIPLVMIVSWTIGIGWVVFGQLNIISAAFAAVLVALGIDYAIHIYNRYIGERANGVDFEEAFAIALEHTGWGVIIGMVTTAIAFLSLLATRFSQLAEFGALAGIGIVLSAPVMLFVLPALLAWRYREKGERAAIFKPSKLGLDHLGSWVENHSRLALTIGIALAVVCAARLYFWSDALLFDERISSLRPPERVFELGGEIARAFSNRNPNSLMLLAYGATEEEAVEKAATLEEKCRDLEHETFISRKGKETPFLVAYESFLRYLPAPSAQRRTLEMLREADLPGALAAFREALQEEGFDEDYFGFTTALLEEHYKRVLDDDVVLPTDLAETPLWRYVKRMVSQTRRTLDLRQELPADLQFPVTVASPAVARSEQIKAKPGDVLDREQLLALFYNPDLTWQEQVKRVTILEPSGWVIKTSIYPPLDETTKAGDPLIDKNWLGKARTAFGIGAASDVGREPVVLAGMPILAHELAEIVKTDFRRVSVAVLVLCTLVLLAFFIRTPIRIVWSLAPILLGLLYLLGFMSIFGIYFNFVNILVVPIIIGIGVDNGIHLTERFFESGYSAKTIIADTGRALIVTALTSIAGFGSLAISGYEGVASMGRLTIWALAWVLFSSLFTVPALLFVVYRRKRQASLTRSQ